MNGLPIGLGVASFGGGCSTGACSCAAKSARIAELEDEVKALRAPERINPRTLYSRFVGRLMTRWAALYPMESWRDPETAADRMAEDVAELRRRNTALMQADSRQ